MKTITKPAIRTEIETELTTLGIPGVRQFSKAAAFNLVIHLGYDVVWRDMPHDHYTLDQVVEVVAQMEREQRWFPNHPRHKHKYTPDQRRLAKKAEAEMSEYAQGCIDLPLRELLRLLVVTQDERYRRLASALLAARIGLADIPR